jgi:hypothetical protein
MRGLSRRGVQERRALPGVQMAGETEEGMNSLDREVLKACAGILIGLAIGSAAVLFVLRLLA